MSADAEKIIKLEFEAVRLKAEIEQLKKKEVAEFKWSKKIIDSIPNPVFMKNSRREFVLCNAAFADMLGLKVNKLLGKRDEDFSSPSETEVFRQKDEEVLENGIINWNQENLTIKNVTKTILTSKTRIEDNEGKFYILGSIADITDDKNQYALLQNSKNEVEEQKTQIETLLQEIHHRVKNNLQLVNSLLNLQMSKIDDPKISSIILNAQNRIFSMAKIHEILCLGDNLSSINLNVYLDSLIRNIRSSFESSKEVVFQTKIANLLMNVELAIPIGLIVNEIITNSVKHGSVKSGPLEIYLSFKKNKKSKFILEIGDNGDVANQKSFIPSLGSELIEVLSEQLEAKLSIPEKTNGTHYLLEFS